MRYFIYVKDGGKGSGYFGHVGRPGKIGGSAESGSTNNPPTNRVYGRERVKEEELNKLPKQRKREYLRIIDREKQITDSIETFNKKHKLIMVGEKFAVKQPASYDRKINEIMQEKNIDEKTAMELCNDVVRYTSITGGKNLVSKTTKMLKDLMNEGYEVLELKNTWLSEGNPYKGINIKLVSPDNVKFELQFHTAQSYDMKERKQHKYYEEWRLPTTSESRKAELNKIMFDYITKNKKWNVPKDIEKLSIENIKKSLQS